MAGGTDLKVDRPRSAVQLIGTTVDLYWRFPFLFLILAGTVVIPYELIVLLVTGEGPFGHAHDSFVVGQVLTLIELGVITPLVSALHVHAVREIRDGKVPRLMEVAKPSLSALPMASVAVTVAYFGAVLGLLALIVPGVLLYLRWSVVAQAAALEKLSWKEALRRSQELTDGHYGHVFILVLIVFFISTAPFFGLNGAFDHDDTTVTSFAVGTAVEVVVASFTALATGLLFFDLDARLKTETSRHGSLDPGTSDDVGDRAPGWYIDPSTPKRMRYWAADGEPGWSERTAKTPRPMLREWQEQHTREGAEWALASGSGELTGHSLDPGVYSDEGRPPGWYVDPDRPWRMRYWRTGGDNPGWSKETTRTPTQVQATWRDLRWRR
jgi:hypothetical protein